MIQVRFTRPDGATNHGRIDGYVVKNGKTLAVIYGDDARFYEVPIEEIKPQ